jgi:hypothetical protein
MKRVFIKHVEKCSECPAHKLARNNCKAFRKCLEYHLMIDDKDADTFPMFCDLKKV